MKNAACIEFISLSRTHFPLLLKWLETPHVKAWWDPDIQWTAACIEEKYSSYVEGYKIVNGIKKPFDAYIMCFNALSIGYIQCYNAYDFPREEGVALEGLPENLAAIDLYIGELDYISKGLGPLLIDQFLRRYVWQYYNACFVDVEASNLQAVRAYEKAAFRHVKTVNNGQILWMLREK